MSAGPGKYDDLCALVRDKVGGLPHGGGVMVIVVNGDRGSGFSCHADELTTAFLPSLLEEVAREMRQESKADDSAVEH